MNIIKIGSNIHKISSESSGKKIMILGGIHGCEKTGILVVGRLLNMFRDREIVLKSGSLVLALGNEEAIKLDKRWARTGSDLNRFFSKKHLDDKTDQSYEAMRARELAEIIKNSDVLLDIHSTNTPSRPFLACENEKKHYNIHKWFGVSDVITDPNYILSGGEYSTTDEYMDKCGGVGVCFETGYASDISALNHVMEGILNILADQKMIIRETDNKNICVNRNVYKMHARIDLTDDGFTFEKGFGDGDFEVVKKGQVIGYHGITVYKSPVDGIVLLQRPRDMWCVGEPVGYIAGKL